MAIDSVNLTNSVKDVKTQIQKPAFGQSVPQKQESEDKTGLIVVGLAAAAAIAAGVMLARGKGNKAVESAKEAAETVANKTNNNVNEVIADAETTVANITNKEQTNKLIVSSNLENEIPQSSLSGKYTETEVVDPAASLSREVRLVKGRVVEDKILLENNLPAQTVSNSGNIAQDTKNTVETAKRKVNESNRRKPSVKRSKNNVSYKEATGFYGGKKISKFKNYKLPLSENPNSRRYYSVRSYSSGEYNNPVLNGRFHRLDRKHVDINGIPFYTSNPLVRTDLKIGQKVDSGRFVVKNVVYGERDVIVYKLNKGNKYIDGTEGMPVEIVVDKKSGKLVRLIDKGMTTEFKPDGSYSYSYGSDVGGRAYNESLINMHLNHPDSSIRKVLTDPASRKELLGASYPVKEKYLKFLELESCESAHLKKAGDDWYENSMEKIIFDNGNIISKSIK